MLEGFGCKVAFRVPVGRVQRFSGSGASLRFGVQLGTHALAAPGTLRVIYSGRTYIQASVVNQKSKVSETPSGPEPLGDL